jgi:hypothetical protein
MHPSVYKSKKTNERKKVDEIWKIFTVVKIWIVVFCVGTPEDGGDMFLRNVCNRLQDHTAARRKRQQYNK